MPNTSCMIYMIPPANFHNPNSFNSSCTLSIAVEEERAAVAEESVEAVAEVISPIASRRSHPALSGVDRFGPPTLERSGSEHRVGRFPPSSLREERLGEKGGAFLKGKEGRVGFRKKSPQYFLEKILLVFERTFKVLQHLMFRILLGKISVFRRNTLINPE